MATQTTAMAEQQGSSNSAGSLSTRIRDYVDDLRTEMKHVSWPSRPQVQATTAVVIGTVFLFAAYFAVVDLVLGRAINQLFHTLARR